MTGPHSPLNTVVVVEEEIHLTLAELISSCRASQEEVIALIDEGVLEPYGNTPSDWRFSGNSLRRALTALRLHRDLHLNAPGVALALDLLDQINELQARLQRIGSN